VNHLTLSPRILPLISIARGQVSDKLGTHVSLNKLFVSCAFTGYQGQFHFYKNFSEELIAYFPFTVLLVSDKRRKKNLVSMCNEVNKTIIFGRLQCWFY
jgi:hypothetical protein